jgi:hypothetical protein
VGTDGAERDRRITDELTRFIRDNPDARVVVDHVAAPKDAGAPRDPTHRKAKKPDVLLACLIVVVAVGLLHVARVGRDGPDQRSRLRHRER